MINIIGDFFGTSGYANHTRNLANALAKQTEVRMSTNLPAGWESNVNDRELLMIKAKPQKDEINLIITLPHQWKLYTGKRNWAYCVWEGDKVPEGFIEDFLNPDIEYIFCPSVHTISAILLTCELAGGDITTQVQKKLKVIPHGVDLSKFYPKPQGERVFTFVANKGFRNLQDRGGIQYLIQAYLEEFTQEDRVELLLKINPAYGIGPINELIKKYAKPNSPVIKINVQNMPYEKLVDLYNQGDVFVSPTRSDAFNLPCLEAMACGLPVITTNFGGQTDFCNEETGWIIGGELTEVEFECMYEGISWLTPNITELRKVMRESYNDKVHITTKGVQALRTAKNMTWDISAHKILDLL